MEWMILEPPIYGLDMVAELTATSGPYRFYVGQYLNGLDTDYWVSREDVMRGTLVFRAYGDTMREAKHAAESFLANQEGMTPRSMHGRSESDEWATPQDFYDALDEEFHFTLDVCALPENAKAARYFTPEQDGLRQDWSGEVCWMNPPYGDGTIGAWVRKAYESSQAGVLVVCLLPSSTDTKWWHTYVLPYGEIRYVKGRLKFGDSKTGARFSNVVVVFRPPIGI